MRILAMWAVISALLLLALLLVARWVELDVSAGEAAVASMVASAVILWRIEKG